MSSTLLTYATGTTPSPLTAGLPNGTVTLLATNNSSNAVTIEGIEVSVPVGTAAGDLTNTPAQIGVELPAGWTQNTPNQPTGFYIFVLIPPQPDTAVPVSNPTITIAPGDALVFTFDNIALNSLSGTADLVITEGSTNAPTQNLDISIFPSGWGTISFTASPSDLTASGDVTLSWNGPANATYKIEYIDETTGKQVSITESGGAALGSSGIYPGQTDPALKIAASTTFTLVVTEEVNGELLKSKPQANVTVSPQAPVITSFTAQLSQDNNGNPSVALNWVTQNAVTVEGSWTSSQLDANPAVPTIIQPPFNTSYTITATDSSGLMATNTISSVWSELCHVNVGNGSIVADVSPDGKYALVLNNSAGTVSVIDASNLNAAVQTITVGNYPESIACAATTTYQYALVTSLFENSIYVIDLNDLTAPVKTINMGSPCANITVTPDGTQAVASYALSNNISVIDLANLTITQTVTAGISIAPGPVAFTPDGKTAVVVNSQDGTALLFDCTNMSGTPATLTLGGVPNCMAITPNGLYAFVTNTGNNTVSVINIAAQTVNSITLGMLYGNSGALAITPDSTQVFVTFAGSVVYVILTASMNTAPQALTIGNDECYSISITPDGLYALMLTASDNAAAISITESYAIQSIPMSTQGQCLAISPVTSADYYYAFTANLQNNTASVLSWGPNTQANG